MNKFCLFVYTTMVLSGLITINHAVHDTEVSIKENSRAINSIADENKELDENVIVKSIEIIGNSSIDKDMIINRLGISVNDYIDNTIINLALHRLYQTNLFRSVEINFNKGTLIVKVIESPVIVKIEGSKDNKEYKAILKQFQSFGIKVGTKLNDRNLQDAIMKTKQGLYASGYLVAQIHPAVEYLDNNKCKLKIDFDLGPRAAIKDISFVGNEYYSDEQLRSEIVSHKYSFFDFLTGMGLNQQFIEADKLYLKSFYESNGFIDFKDISVNYDYMHTGDYVNIIYHINEGKRYYFRDLRIEVKDTKINPNKLNKLLKVKPGSYFDLHKVKDIAQEVTEELEPQGNYICDYDIIKDTDSNSVDVVFTIAEAPKNIIDNIYIIGNTKTRDRVIRRELLLHELDILDPLKVEKSRRRIAGLSFIDNAKISPINNTNGSCDLLVNVFEGKSFTSLSFSGGATASTEAGGFNLTSSVTFDNIFGTGNMVSLSGMIDSDKYSGTLGFVNSSFMDYQGVVFGVKLFGSMSGETFIKKISKDIFGNRVDEEKAKLKISSTGKLSTTLGATTNIAYTLTNNILHDVSYTLKSSKGKMEDLASVLYNIGEYDNVYSILGSKITYSTLDNRIIPRNGINISYGLEFSGIGGGVQYFKHTLQGSYYKSFFNSNVTFKLSAAFNAIQGIKKSVDSLDLLNINEGDLRGFERGGIGPLRDVSYLYRDDDIRNMLYDARSNGTLPKKLAAELTAKLVEKDSYDLIQKIKELDDDKKQNTLRIGGNYSLMASAEVFLSLGKIFEKIDGRVSLFTDIGSLWGFDCSQVDKKFMVSDTLEFDLRASVGAAFSFTIVGNPLQIYYAVPIKKAGKDVTKEFGFKLTVDI